MSLPAYLIKINGKYYAGIDYDGLSTGKAGHMGWQPRDIELEPIKFVDNEDEAYKAEGNLNLRSVLDKIYDRIRYGGLTLETLEIRRVSQ